MSLQAAVKAHVLDRYHANNGNLTHTARELGIALRTLRRWINLDLWPYRHKSRN